MLQQFWDYLRTKTRDSILKGMEDAFEMLNSHSEEATEANDQPTLLVEWEE